MKNKVLTITLNPAIDLTIEVPNFCIGSVNKALKSRRDPGGKGINVATALSSKNIDVHVSGFLGKDGGERSLWQIQYNVRQHRQFLCFSQVLHRLEGLLQSSFAQRGFLTLAQSHLRV